MSLSVGIVGLPNAGKSTLFNALVARRLAQTAPYPFTTIDPHEAVVPVPDSNLAKLTQIIKPEKTTPASVTFIDIAGLVKGASQGEGLGNQFLAKIREVDAVIHVVRAFEDANVPHPSSLRSSGQAPSSPVGESGQAPLKEQAGLLAQMKEDLEIINLELELGGIVGKPTLYVINAGEKQLSEADSLLSSLKLVIDNVPALVVAAKLEEELTDLEPAERVAYFKELKISKTGLEQLIASAYKLLNLITFYTIKGAGPSSATASEGRGEIRAWALKKGSTALAAAGKVHTDFALHFIKAEVIPVMELLAIGSWTQAKELGKIQLAGRDYLLHDGDVVEFKVGA